MTELSEVNEGTTALRILDALFPDAIVDGKIDTTEIIRQCQWRASTILDCSREGLEGTEASREDNIDAARHFVGVIGVVVGARPSGVQERTREAG